MKSPEEDIRSIALSLRYIACLLSFLVSFLAPLDRKSTRLNSSHITRSRMPSSA